MTDLLSSVLRPSMVLLDMYSKYQLTNATSSASLQSFLYPIGLKTKRGVKARQRNKHLNKIAKIDYIVSEFIVSYNVRCALYMHNLY